MNGRLLLIDGDLFAYRNAAAAENGVNWGDGQWTLHADFDTASVNMKSEIDSLARKLHGEKIVVCLSDDEHSWRRERVFSGYKEHRDGVRKPMILADMKQFLRDEYEVKEKPTLEADDVMGIIATNPKLYPDYVKVIVSRDKDMQTIPGLLWHDDKLKTISQEFADRFHLLQTLIGDKADGYPGCPGIGPKRAEKIVEGGWPAIVEAFEKGGKDEDYALQMARCARILRHQDWDYKIKEPKLWTPTVASS